MHQICDGYNQRVLMGNWYQESYSVPQPARDNPSKVSRCKQAEIGFIDNKGKLRALNTVSRVQPWNTNDLVTHSSNPLNITPANTINKQNYDLPTLSNFHTQFRAQPFAKQSMNDKNKTYMQVDKFHRHHRMFNQKNCNQLLVQRQSDELSFKSLLKANEKVDNKKLLQSIYGMQISQPGEMRVARKDGEIEIKKREEVKSFRRIRSEITLNTTVNFPFTCK